MNPRSVLPRMLLCAIGLALPSLAHADTLTKSGTFAADNDVFSYSFSTASQSDYTFTTTSFASGGFVPVLTLYNTTTKQAIGNDGPTPGPRDASLSEDLGPGSYELFLTEFPNEAAGNLLTDGFQFANEPYITGQLAGLGDVSFIDDVDGSQRTGNYSVNISSVAATPEPSSWSLMLSGAALVALAAKRRQLV